MFILTVILHNTKIHNTIQEYNTCDTVVNMIVKTIILYCCICNYINNCIPTHLTPMLQKAQPLYDYKNAHFKQSFL